MLLHRKNKKFFYGAQVAHHGGGGGPGGSTWNPADLTANITLSNGNLTALGTTTSDGGVRSTSSKTSGQFYIEITWNQVGLGVDVSVGICLASAILSSVGSTVSGACLAYTGGNIWFNTANTGKTIGVFSGSDVIGIAVDLGNKTIWFRRNSGNWNGTVGADPATNTSGISISTIFPGAGAYIAFTSNGVNNQVTANFGGSAFSFSAPSGFTAWG